MTKTEILVSLTISAAVLVVSLAFRAVVVVDRPPQDGDMRLNMAYGEQRGQRMDIFYPDELPTTHMRVVVVVPEASARGLRHRPELGRISERHVVVVVRYRSGSKHPFPTPVQDLGEAMDYLRDNAETLGLNTEKMSLLGIEEGGYVAALYGTSDGRFLTDNANVPIRLRGIAVVGGVVDLKYAASVDEELAESYKRFLGESESDELLDSANPINYVTSDDPSFLLAMSPEKQIDLEIIRRFDARLNEHGISTWFVQEQHPSDELNMILHDFFRERMDQP